MQPDGCGRQRLHHWVTWTPACCAYGGQASTEQFILNASLLLVNEVSQKIENCEYKYKNIIEFQQIFLILWYRFLWQKLLVFDNYISNIEFAVSSNVTCPELWLKKIGEI